MTSEAFIHANAICESVDVGPRTRIWAFAHVMEGAKIGSDCNICDHAFVESGAIIGNRVTVKNNCLLWEKVTIEDEVFLGPNVVFTNDPNPRVAFKKKSNQFEPTLVRRGASLGANATIMSGIAIGQSAFVGAGSVILRDVPAHAVVVGNPGRQLGWICKCGKRLDEALSCSCGRRYRELEGEAGLTAIEE